VQIDFPNERKQQKARQQIVTVGNEDNQPIALYLCNFCQEPQIFVWSGGFCERNGWTGLYVVFFYGATNDPNQGMTIIFQLSRNNVWKI
jgi:hypothetical protein